MTLLLIAALTGTPDPCGAGLVTTAPIRVSASGLPMVRVEVTEERRAWFVLDTGATGTTIHDRLANELGLAAAGVATMGTVTGKTQLPLVRVPTIRLPGLDWSREVVAGSHAMTTVRRAAPEAEGILGQDVLACYDYLLDYDGKRLVIGHFEPPEHGIGVPLAWSAGRPVLLVEGKQAPHGLVLDSGADVLVMEAVASRDALRAPATQRRLASLDTHVGAQQVEVESHPALRLATMRLIDVDVVRLPSAAWRMGPEVGVLPAAYFSKVYVSARTGRAVVWEK